MGVGGKLTETETETEAFDIDSSPELIFPQLAKSFSFVRNSPPPVGAGRGRYVYAHLDTHVLW